MANGEMLKELRSMAQAEKVTTPTALRLICSALADMFEQVKIAAGAQESLKAELAMLQEDLCAQKDENDDAHKAISQENNRQLTELTVNVNTALTEIRELRALHETMNEQVRSNVMVVIGQFIKDHPKAATFIGFLIFVVFNLWFVDPFRKAALVILNVPPDVIEILAP